MKIAKKDFEVTTANNGTKYVITDGSAKTVKKVSVAHSLQDLDKLSLQLKEDYKAMTVKLYRFIKDRVKNENDVSYKGGYVRYKLYKLSYRENGFSIIDEKNYSKSVDHKLGHLPMPEDIINFIDALKINKTVVKTEKEQKNLKVNELLQKVNAIVNGKVDYTDKTIRSVYNDFKKDKTVEETTRNHFLSLMVHKFPYLNPQVADIGELRKRAIKFVNRCTDGEKLTAKLSNFIPHRSFNVFFGKLARKFKRRKIRFGAFKSQTLNLLKNEEV